MTEGLNPHRGRTGDLKTDALDAATSIFLKNALPYMSLMEWEDEKQSWYLHVLTHLHTYNPEKAGIYTWVKSAWRTWWIRAGEKRLERAGYERTFDPTPAAYDGVDNLTLAQRVDAMGEAEPPVHDSSPLVEELLAMVPQEKRRPALFDVVALGASPSSVADRYGVSTSAVQGWVKHAKEIWRDHYGVVVEKPRVAKPTDTHCTKGHEFTPENTNWSKGRRCITCTTEYRRRHTEARRADIAAMHAA